MQRTNLPDTPMRIVGFTLAAAFICLAFLSTVMAQDSGGAIVSKKVEPVTPVWTTTLTRE